MLAGYALAAAAASAFLHLVWLGGLGSAGEGEPQYLAGSLLVSAAFLALLLAYLAFLPTVVVLGLAEIFAWRDWLSYAIAGAAVALLVLGAARYGLESRMILQDPLATPPPEDLLSGPAALLEALGAGLVGGMAYWIVAGRGAGTWRRPSRPSTGPSAPGPSGS
jgi:hypothetical protein